jgi:hypothetical protein
MSAPRHLNEALGCDDVKAILAIAKRDMNALKAIKGSIHARMIIEHLKNAPDALDFFLTALAHDPGAGSYFFTKIEGTRSFDIYKKHNIRPSNLHKTDVTPEQWAHMVKIGYVRDDRPSDEPDEDTSDDEDEGDEGDE